MSVLICFKTMTPCQTPGMCSPHGGCRPDNESKHLDLGNFIDWIWSLKTERDQLKTENAGLKTGYEAYERVNAELRAEIEAREIYDSWKGQEGFVPWVKGGNSLKQDEARSLARAAIGKEKSHG